MAEFRILGPFEVVHGDGAVAVGGLKQAALLAILLVHRGEAVSTDRLIDELWGDQPPSTAAKTLQVYVSNLRKAIGSETIVTLGHGYRLQTTPEQVDAGRFAQLCAEGRQALAGGDPAAARASLDAALTLWRGDPLPEFAYERFAQAEIARLQEDRLTALEDRIDADLQLGRHDAVVGELQGLITRHPTRERLLWLLMLAQYRCGRQVDALESYRRGRRALGEELGLEPGPRLQELEQAILRHDPWLQPPDLASPVAAALRRPVVRGGLAIALGGVLLLAAAAAAIAVLTGGSPAPSATPNSVVAIDAATDQVAGQVPVGASPGAIAFGSGSLWVANVDDQTVSRIDPATLRTLRTKPVGDPPIGLSVSGGAIWVLQSDLNPAASTVSVSRIDTEFDSIGPTVRLPSVAPGGRGGVAADGNSVWVSPSQGLLTRLDATTGRAVQHFDPNATLGQIAVGYRAVWGTDTAADDVIRIDPTGVVTAIGVGNGPGGIAVGAGGVWVADALDNAVKQIDPNTRSVITTIEVGRSPAGIAVGAGSVWVANAGDGTVTRIDPLTSKVLATIEVGGSPQAVTIAAGRAWVTVDPRSRPPAAVASGGGTLRLQSSIDVDAMDPGVAYTALSFQLLWASCAGLVNYPDESGPTGARPVPEIGQSLPARSADGRTYTFRIRPGFRFSPPSDQPVTAETFKYSIERTLNPKMKSPAAPFLADVIGARAYMAGKASHISGIVAQGDTLRIRLLAPAPSFIARIAIPAFCAVPSDTPPNPVRVIPSAGPYYVSSYAPGQGVVLLRNPNYHGSRPRHFARIDLAVGISAERAIADIEAGRADYTNVGLWGPDNSRGLTTLVAQLATRYGPARQATTTHKPRYFVNPVLETDFIFLNTHRPLFSDVRNRLAVNYAIDRSTLAAQGRISQPGPDRLADHYLPPGIAGFRGARLYPSTPDLRKARELMHANGGTAVLYTCNVSPCPEQAQIVKTDLATIGLQVQIKSFPSPVMYTRLGTPGEPFDLWPGQYRADYPDPQGVLNPIFDGSQGLPTLNDRTYLRRLAAAARLSGPERYLTYGKLDLDLARNAAPLVAYGNATSSDFFAARIGCQTYNYFYGMDLGALCIRPR